MGFATANPNEYLVVGKNGKVTNHGTGIRVYLWPGSTFVRIPSTKQEAVFEMTQETKDGIPLRFKGIAIYRISDPVTASMSFNFTNKTGLQEINALINNICLGELRAVVSGMTMDECIEQRKTVLTASVDRALREIVNNQEGSSNPRWGIELELIQVAQVFIVDNVLRKQLEAQVRNEIRSKSEQSDIRTLEEIGLVQIASERQMQEQKQINEKNAIHQKEEIMLAQIASDSQIREQKQGTEKDVIRQKEEIMLAQIASERQIREQKMVIEKDAIRQKEEIEAANLLASRRSQKQNQEAEKELILLAAETFKLEQEAAKEKAETEAPVRLLQIDNQHEIYRRELEMKRVEVEIHEMEMNQEIFLEKIRHELRKEILPVEQIPAIADSLSKVFKDTNLSFIGSENQLLASILPLVQIVSGIVKDGIHITDKYEPVKED